MKQEFDLGSVIGPKGANVTSIAKTGTDQNGGNIHTITFSDGVTQDFTAPKGPKGDDGAGTVLVGGVAPYNIGFDSDPQTQINAKTDKTDAFKITRKQAYIPYIAPGVTSPSGQPIDITYTYTADAAIPTNDPGTAVVPFGYKANDNTLVECLVTLLSISPNNPTFITNPVTFKQVCEYGRGGNGLPSAGLLEVIQDAPGNSAVINNLLFYDNRLNDDKWSMHALISLPGGEMMRYYAHLDGTTNGNVEVEFNSVATKDYVDNAITNLDIKTPYRTTRTWSGSMSSGTIATALGDIWTNRSKYFMITIRTAPTTLISDNLCIGPSTTNYVASICYAIMHPTDSATETMLCFQDFGNANWSTLTNAYNSSNQLRGYMARPVIPLAVTANSVFGAIAASRTFYIEAYSFG